MISVIERLQFMFDSLHKKLMAVLRTTLDPHPILFPVEHDGSHCISHRLRIEVAGMERELVQPKVGKRGTALTLIRCTLGTPARTLSRLPCNRTGTTIALSASTS